MSQSRYDNETSKRSWRFGSKTFVAWTVFSALAVWLGLSIVEGLAIEQCRADALAWNWKSWQCQPYGGTIILPPGLRRAGSD
jgi:hypothetical protein